jgi:hypothetical protein
MSFSGALGAAFWDTQPVPPSPFDYLYPNGAGFALLQSVAAQTTDLLLSNKGGYVDTGATKAPLYIPADPLIAAVWGGHTESAHLFGSTMVSTMVAEERHKTDRMPLYSFVFMLAKRITDAMRASGDPSSCLIAFETSMGSWKSLYPAVGSTASGWCKRDLVFSGSCTVLARCAQTMDPATGKPQNIPAPAPNRYQLTVPLPASATGPVAPPTHAQIDAAVRSAGVDAAGKADQTAQLSEFGLYAGALAQARVWLILALGLPTTASDQAIWDALAARGVAPEEALDWFTSCEASADCFRERMNAALGEIETIARDNRAKAFVVVGVVAATAFAFLTWRRR